MTNFGFIGMGIMGEPMTLRLIEAGHTLTSLDAWQMKSIYK